MKDHDIPIHNLCLIDQNPICKAKEKHRATLDDCFIEQFDLVSSWIDQWPYTCLIYRNHDIENDRKLYLKDGYLLHVQYDVKESTSSGQIQKLRY